MDLKGSKTEKNLWAAFAGESEARNKYTYYASQAKKEGLEHVAGVFMETADNEKEHAKLWFKYLEGIGDAKSNLAAARDGEHYENTEMYPEFARVAREEGFKEIAMRFELVGKVEAEHEKRYAQLLENLEKELVFKRDVPTTWRCRNCGYIHEGKSAPNVCPACAHPQAYFEIAAFNY